MLKMITHVIAVSFNMFRTVIWERRQSCNPSHIILMVLVDVAGSAVLFPATVMDLGGGDGNVPVSVSACGGKDPLYLRVVLVDFCLNCPERSGCLLFH